MQISDYDVQPLFAEPYFRTNLSDAITPEQEQLIKSLVMRPNQQNLISENLSIFELPELKSIKNAVQAALDIYATKVMGIKQKLYVTQSWALINQPNVGMHTHSHSNSLVSGSLYFTKLPDPKARMIFERHTSYRQLEISPTHGENNIFNTPINVVTPNTHDLILFSSQLNHSVEANMSANIRYSIAFNCFIKGTIGNLSDVSSLTL